MKLKLNPEFAKRHLFVVVLMAALGCWFGYDGLVKYPSMTPEALYESIEGSRPPEGMKDQELEGFKRQKTQTQYGFSTLALLASLAVGIHLWKTSRFDFSFDETSFVWKGESRRIADVKSVDRARWGTKGIVVVDGITLDAWHHLGVKEFEKLLPR